MRRLLLPIILTLILLESVSDRGYVRGCALDRALSHLRVEICNKLQLACSSSCHSPIVAEALSLIRRVRRIEPRRMTRLTLQVSAPSIATTVLLVDLQSRQSPRDVIYTASAGPDVRVPIAAELRSPIVSAPGVLQGEDLPIGLVGY